MKLLQIPVCLVTLTFLSCGTVHADPPQRDQDATRHGEDLENELRTLHQSLVKELGLNQNQQRKLRAILADVHRQHAEPEPPIKAEIRFSEKSVPEEVDIHVDVDAEQAAEAVEELVEHFAGQMERQAEALESKLEAFGERMEAWSDRFVEGWEAWAESHEDEWEAWADRFADKWEVWSEELQETGIESDRIQEVVHGNLQMFSEMPLPELYDQLVTSLKRIEDVPWDELQGVEQAVRDALVRSQEVMAEMSENQLAKEMETRLRFERDSVAADVAGQTEQASQRVENVEAMLKRIIEAEQERAERAEQRARRFSEKVERHRAAEHDREASRHREEVAEIDALRRQVKALRREVAELKAALEDK